MRPLFREPPRRLRADEDGQRNSRRCVVSGIYDLLPVRLSARNDYVRLDEKLEDEYTPDPPRRTGSAVPVTVAWAEHEAAEFARQSREFSPNA